MLKYTPLGMIGKMNLKIGLNLGIRIHVRWKLNLKVEYVMRLEMLKLSMLWEWDREVKYVMRMRDHYLLSPPTGFE